MSSEVPPPVVVPYTQLSDSALRGVIEAFVLREGTDYGDHEYSLDEKVAHVRHQLASGEAAVVFDPGSNSVDIVRVPAAGPRHRAESAPP